jgi:hypothetical protein
MAIGETPPATVVGTTVDGGLVATVVAGDAEGSVEGVEGEVVARLGRTAVCGIVCGGGPLIETALWGERETATAIRATAAAAAVATAA